MITGVQYNDTLSVWPQVRDYINNAIKYSDGQYTEDSVKHAIINRDMQLWVFDDLAAGVTEIAVYPEKKVCRLLLVGGKNIEVWHNCLETIEQWATSQGCASLEISGRKGWERFLKNDGFEVTAITVRKKLNE